MKIEKRRVNSNSIKCCYLEGLSEFECVCVWKRLSKGAKNNPNRVTYSSINLRILSNSIMEIYRK